MVTSLMTFLFRPKIEEISTSQTNAPKVSPKIPVPIKDLPAIGQMLGSKQPDPSVKYSVLSTVLSYCFLMRLYNGDLLDTLPQSVELLLAICPVLQKTVVYNSTDECICAFLTYIQTDVSLSQSIDPVEMTLVDVKTIFCSPSAVEALSDLHDILKKSRKFFKVSNEVDYSQILLLAMKKLKFLASYANGYTEELQNIDSYLGDIRGRFLKERQLMKDGKVLIENNMDKLKPKLLIEEIES